MNRNSNKRNKKYSSPLDLIAAVRRGELTEEEAQRAIIDPLLALDEATFKKEIERLATGPDNIK